MRLNKVYTLSPSWPFTSNLLIADCGPLKNGACSQSSAKRTAHKQPLWYDECGELQSPKTAHFCHIFFFTLQTPIEYMFQKVQKSTFIWCSKLCALIICTDCSCLFTNKTIMSFLLMFLYFCQEGITLYMTLAAHLAETEWQQHCTGQYGPGHKMHN